MVYTLFPQLNSLKICTYNYKNWGENLCPFFLLLEDKILCLAAWPWICSITSNDLPFLIHCFYSPDIKITDIQLSLLQSHFLCGFPFFPFLWRLQIINRPIVVYVRLTGGKKTAEHQPSPSLQLRIESKPHGHSPRSTSKLLSQYFFMFHFGNSSH